jgi:hypothetical protein
MDQITRFHRPYFIAVEGEYPKGVTGKGNKLHFEARSFAIHVYYSAYIPRLEAQFRLVHLEHYTVQFTDHGFLPSSAGYRLDWLRS